LGKIDRLPTRGRQRSTAGPAVLQASGHVMAAEWTAFGTLGNPLRSRFLCRRIFRLWTLFHVFHVV